MSESQPSLFDSSPEDPQPLAPEFDPAAVSEHIAAHARPFVREKRLTEAAHDDQGHGYIEEDRTGPSRAKAALDETRQRVADRQAQTQTGRDQALRDAADIAKATQKARRIVEDNS